MSIKNENAAAKIFEFKLPGLFLKILLVFNYNGVKNTQNGDQIQKRHVFTCVKIHM